MTRPLLSVALLAAATAAQAAGDPVAGRAAFAPCASCHAVAPGARSGFGPPLAGIHGRRAAAAPDFRYSDALRRSGLVWDDTTLAAFIRDPGRTVPGTSMRFSGATYSDQRIADLVAYLRSLPAGPAR